jgi:hypothetical protein
MAQTTNVYSLNAVGYINVTVEPGFNMISCPLQASPDNTINTLLTNGAGAYKKFQFWKWAPAGTPAGGVSGGYTEDIGSGSGWLNKGVETLNPGEAGWLFNPGGSAVTVTFVGQVPTGTLSVPLQPGAFTMISSPLPTSGNIVTNTLMNFTNATKKDQAWVWTESSAGTGSYTESIATGAATWLGGNDPAQTQVGGGFWYLNNTGSTNYWVENFSVGQ